MSGGYKHRPTEPPERLARRIRELEARQDRLDAAIKGLGLTIDPTTDSLVVSSGRAIQVTDGSGHVVAQIGTQPGFEFTGGAPQAGVSFYREDGTLAVFLGDATPTVLPVKQSFQIFDRAGNVVVADDTNGGKGLANPYVGGGVVFADTNTARWPQTTSASFIDVATGWYRVQNPRLSWDFSLVTDAATAGQARLLIAGTQVSTTQTVGTSFTDWFGSRVALPAGVNIGDIVSVQLQLRRTSGTGIVYGICQRFEGDQSP